MNKRIIVITILFLFIFSSFSYGMIKPVFIDYGNTKLVTLNNPVIQNGRVYIPIRQVSETYGATVNYYDRTKKIEINLNNIKTEFYINSYYVNINGIKKKMDTTPIVSSGITMVPIRFLSNYLEIKVVWNQYSRVIKLTPPKNIVITDGIEKNTTVGKINTDKIVVIDAGHGGSQSGAQYGGVSEKDLNLDIAIMVTNMLKDLNIKTILTRSDDETVSLEERSNVANNNNAALFISIHNNASPYDYNYSGTETLYNPNKNASSITNYELSSLIEKEVVENATTINRGLKVREDLYVLNHTNMPSALVEVGYMTDNEELSRLKNNDFKKKVARGITNAIISALSKIN